MRKQRHQQVEAITEVRLWTHAEAVKVLPYLRSIVASLRDHWLYWRQVELQVRRLDARSGRPDRQTLILRAEAAREVEIARNQFHQVLGELQALGVFCLDPARGLALIPFREGEELAWFVFDLFAFQGLESWRFHSDPLEMRRPLAERRDLSSADQVFASLGDTSWLPQEKRT
jgi:hypothetical protein